MKYGFILLFVAVFIIVDLFSGFVLKEVVLFFIFLATIIKIIMLFVESIVIKHRSKMS